MGRQSKPINWKKNLFFIWLSQILSIAGFNSALPFIPIYVRDTWGITEESELGAWMSAFYFFGMLSFCVFTPLWGILADRYGRKLMLLRACYVDALLFPCMLLAPNPVWLIIVRFIVSAFTGTVSASQTLIVTTTPEEHHGFALGLLSTAIWSGSLIGVAGGGLLVHYFGFTVAFFCCGGMYLIGGIVAQLFVRENFTRPTEKASCSVSASWSGLPTAVWFIFFLVLLTAVARRFDDPYVALMIERVNGSDCLAFYTGWISALAALGGVISGVILGRLCDLYSPQRIAIPVLLVAGITMGLEGVAGSLTLYGSWRFINYLFAGGLEAAFMAILSHVCDTQRRGAVFGLASGIRMAGILLSAALSGVIVYWAGVPSVYYVGAVLFLLAIPVFMATTRSLKNAPHQAS